MNVLDGPTPVNLVATVRAVLPSLTPAAQAIARLILDDPGMVARSTITEFSAVSGTSEATIVRTARAWASPDTPSCASRWPPRWPGTSPSGWSPVTSAPTIH